MKRLALAIALACVLSGVARAGEISSTGVVAPPPPTTVEIHSNGVIGESHTTDAISSTVLTIILTTISIVP